MKFSIGSIKIDVEIKSMYTDEPFIKIDVPVGEYVTYINITRRKDSKPLWVVEIIVSEDGKPNA